VTAALAGQFDEASRVKLGASPQATPAILALLAADPAVTVRAAVALNDATPAGVQRSLANDGDERVRMLLARKLADFAFGGAEEEHLQSQAARLLEGLVRDEAVRVRLAIAGVLKEMPGAPKEIVMQLAQDTDIAVSEPIIRLSPLLAPEDLLALLAAPPAPETVTAIARRPHLSEQVSDAIAASAHSAAIHALLANRSAGIREATLDSLVAQSVHHCEWHEPLVQRPALPPKAARALADVVATQYLELLAARADLAPELTGELQEKLARRLKSDGGQDDMPERLSREEATARARVIQQAGRLTEETLLRAAQRGEARLASALLALAADMPFSAVERAASLRSAKGLISLCWKAGFSMRVAGPLQSLLCRIPPNEVLGAGIGGNYLLAPSEMRWQLEFLGRSGR
jgi:uncharacterized protein (DUF2336 family)